MAVAWVVIALALGAAADAFPATRGTSCGYGVILNACYEYKNGWSVWIETVELDDRNIAHATTRVSAAEICEVFDNDPVFCRNRSGRISDYVAIGVIDGGSRVRVNFIYDLARSTARPVSAWRLS